MLYSIQMAKRGFTLLELLLVLAMLGLLAGLFYRAALLPHRERVALAELHAFLRQARTEAIRRGHWVTAQLQEASLVLCLDTNGNARCEAGEPLLRQLDPRAYGARLELHAGFQPGLRYNALGRLNTGARLVVRVGERATALCLSLAGRVREVRGERC